MNDEAKRIAEALRHVGTSLTNDTLNCGACPMQDIPVAEMDCGSKCPETLMHLAADLIEKLSAQLVNQATEYSAALKITTEQRDAAVDDIELGVCCETCKHDNDDDEGAFCVGCVRVTSRGNWEWRGVHENA